MDDLEDELLALAGDNTQSTSKSKAKPAAKRRKSTAKKKQLKKKKSKYNSDSDDVDSVEEDDFEDDEEQDFDNSEDDDVINESEEERIREDAKYGEDLIGDDDDRRRLEALTEVQREEILLVRSEKRQKVLDQMEIRRRMRELTSGRKSSRKTASEPKKKSLSDLKNRREKKVSRASTDSRKRRYSSDESESEDGAFIEKQPATKEDILSILVTRNDVERWLHSSFFVDTFIGCYVRIGLGVDAKTQKRVYRVARVEDVVESNKAYHVGKTLVKLQFKAAHAKSEKIFSLEIISNSPVTDSEWSRYETTMKQQNVSFPKKVDVVEKLKEIKQAKDHVFTEKEINAMIAAKQAISTSSHPTVNPAVRKVELTRLLEIALQKDPQPTEEIAKIRGDLAAITEQLNKKIGDGHLGAFATVNRRNREANMREGRKAEKKENKIKRGMRGYDTTSASENEMGTMEIESSKTGPKKINFDNYFKKLDIKIELCDDSFLDTLDLDSLV